MMEDEGDDLAAEMATAVSRDGGRVPALFRWEVQSALLMAVRRKRIAAETMRLQLQDLDALGLVVDAQILTAPFTAGLDLAERFGLSSYDAAYLELATRLGRPLMTRDARLAAAASELQVLWEAPKGET